MEELILIFILGYVFGYWIGYHLRNIRLIKALSDNPEHFIQVLKKVQDINRTEAQASQDSEAITVDFEVHNSYYYAFNRLNGEFLGQGPGQAEALRMAQERFPGKKFWYDKLEQNNQTG